MFIFDLGHVINNPFLNRRYHVAHEKYTSILHDFVAVILPSDDDAEKYVPSTSLLHKKKKSISKICIV